MTILLYAGGDYTQYMLPALVAAGLALYFLSLYLRGGDGQTQYVNAYEEAASFVRSYHRERVGPFHRGEQEALARRVSIMFGLREETALEILRKEWPWHRGPGIGPEPSQ